MRKISLKNLNFEEIELLSREQLKNVLGGDGFFTGDTSAGPCKSASQVDCTTGDGEKGTCQYCSGIWGCSPVKC